jgi:hypothetical protein
VRETKYTQWYVSQISCAEIERISKIVASSKIKFSKNVRAFTQSFLNLRVRVFRQNKQILCGIKK